MTASDLRTGQKGRITAVGGRGAIRQRLLDLGLRPRAEIVIERVAPAGDPIWVRLGATQLALRQLEAASISVEAAGARVLG